MTHNEDMSTSRRLKLQLLQQTITSAVTIDAFLGSQHLTAVSTVHSKITNHSKNKTYFWYHFCHDSCSYVIPQLHSYHTYAAYTEYNKNSAVLLKTFALDELTKQPIICRSALHSASITMQALKSAENSTRWLTNWLGL